MSLVFLLRFLIWLCHIQDKTCFSSKKVSNPPSTRPTFYLIDMYCNNQCHVDWINNAPLQYISEKLFLYVKSILLCFVFTVLTILFCDSCEKIRFYFILIILHLSGKIFRPLYYRRATFCAFYVLFLPSIKISTSNKCLFYPCVLDAGYDLPPWEFNSNNFCLVSIITQHDSDYELVLIAGTADRQLSFVQTLYHTV